LEDIKNENWKTLMKEVKKNNKVTRYPIEWTEKCNFWYNVHTTQSNLQTKWNLYHDSLQRTRKPMLNLYGPSTKVQINKAILNKSNKDEAFYHLILKYTIKLCWNSKVLEQIQTQGEWNRIEKLYVLPCICRRFSTKFLITCIGKHSFDIRSWENWMFTFRVKWSTYLLPVKIKHL
jgi:hypothetical protein